MSVEPTPLESIDYYYQGDGTLQLGDVIFSEEDALIVYNALNQLEAFGASIDDFRAFQDLYIGMEGHTNVEKILQLLELGESEVGIDIKRVISTLLAECIRQYTDSPVTISVEEDSGEYFLIDASGVEVDLSQYIYHFSYSNGPIPCDVVPIYDTNSTTNVEIRDGSVIVDGKTITVADYISSGFQQLIIDVVNSSDSNGEEGSIALISTFFDQFKGIAEGLNIRLSPEMYHGAITTLFGQRVSRAMARKKEGHGAVDSKRSRHTDLKLVFEEVLESIVSRGISGISKSELKRVQNHIVSRLMELIATE